MNYLSIGSIAVYLTISACSTPVSDAQRSQLQELSKEIKAIDAATNPALASEGIENDGIRTIRTAHKASSEKITGYASKEGMSEKHVNEQAKIELARAIKSAGIACVLSQTGSREPAMNEEITEFGYSYSGPQCPISMAASFQIQNIDISSIMASKGNDFDMPKAKTMLPMPIKAEIDFSLNSSELRSHMDITALSIKFLMRAEQGEGTLELKVSSQKYGEVNMTGTLSQTGFNGHISGKDLDVELSATQQGNNVVYEANGQEITKNEFNQMMFFDMKQM